MKQCVQTLFFALLNSQNLRRNNREKAWHAAKNQTKVVTEKDSLQVSYEGFLFHSLLGSFTLGISAKRVILMRWKKARRLVSSVHAFNWWLIGYLDFRAVFNTDLIRFSRITNDAATSIQTNTRQNYSGLEEMGAVFQSEDCTPNCYVVCEMCGMNNVSVFW